MKKAVAKLDGDGIGPEIVPQACRVVDTVGEVYGHNFEYRDALIGGAAWEEYGAQLPEETLETCRECDAVLMGAVGGPKEESELPKWKDVEKNALLGCRYGLGLYANFRPAKVFDILADSSSLKRELVEGVDIMQIRELLGGIYFGNKQVKEIVLADGRVVRPGRGEIEEGRYGIDVSIYTEPEVERILKVAFEAAMKRKRKLCVVHKANVLDSAGWMFHKLANEMVGEYPEIELREEYVDIMAQKVAQNPRQFDTIVGGNSHLDIISDLMGTIMGGSVGLLPSASLADGSFGLYEPVHGSAPDIAGRGDANPIAQILSAGMMLKYSFGMVREADAIEAAVMKTLEDGYRTPDIVSPETLTSKVVGTAEFTDRVIERLKPAA